MRFLNLQLVAYGPFRDRTLDFSLRPLSLHLIYGRNEAGKSTALRAVSGLLFGIPARTPDAHLFKPADLRIAARLEGEDGEVLAAVRRKRNARTLLDGQGDEIDEARLERLLHGVTRELFETMFGLDHQRLERGAEALLQGKGSVGESLFAAGLGVSGLHEVLARLNDEADRIFTPRATSKPLNEALRKWSDAHKRSREKAYSGEAWEKSTREIEALRGERQRLEEEAREQRQEEHFLRRAERALPLLARYRSLAAARHALGVVAPLDDDAASERVAREREARGGEAAIEALHREIAALEAQRAALVVPESLLLETARIEDLRDRLAGQHKASAELPRLRGALKQLDEEVRMRLRRAGTLGRLEDLESRRVATATEVRVRALAGHRVALTERRRAARFPSDLRARLAEVEARLARLPPPGDPRLLRETVARVQREGDIEGRMCDLAAEVELKRARGAAHLAALGLHGGPLEALPGLPLPSAESVERHAAAHEELDRLRQRVEDETRALRARRAEIETQIEALKATGEVSTADDLDAARRVRDEGFERLRRAWKDGAVAGKPARRPAGSKPPEEAYLRAVRQADELADQLRRDAERVSRLAALLAERAATERETGRLEAERADLAGRLAEAADAWRQLWKPAGVAPLSPGEMRGWLDRAVKLIALVEELDRRDHERAELHRAIAAHRLALRLARGEPIGASVAESGEPLAGELEAARRSLEACEDGARERAEMERRGEELRTELGRLAEQRAELEAEEAAWREAWTESMAAIGLAPEALPEEATAVLDELSGLFQTADEAARRRLEIEQIEREAERFDAEVRSLAAEHAPELAQLPADAAAVRLEQRYRRGREDLVQREQVDRHIEDKRSILADQEERLARAREDLASRMQRAGVATLKDLAQAELRSRETRDLDRSLSEAKDQVAEAGGGASVEALQAELGGLDPDRVAVRLEEIERRVAEIQERIHEVHDRVASIEIGLGSGLGGPESPAAEAAAEAQEWQAQARTQALDYVRVQLAATLLQRQIEQYRKRHQGPVLTRATGIFSRLTLGSFVGLSPDFDERAQPVLRGIRPDGASVSVEDMSEGSRLQLFLALRIASLERHLAANPPLPLVLDDIFEKFDDDRARSGLELLGELSERVQILFFTHHQHLLELARETLPAARWREHDLG